MNLETEPSQPDFKSRKALVAQIGENTLIRHGNITLRSVHPDNPYFPHFLYGEDTETGESVTISLDDNQLPTILEGRKSVEPAPQKPQTIERTPPPPSRPARGSTEDLLNRNLREMVESTGDPFLGILTKLYTQRGMSSQLIMRFDAIKRGEIKELLPGEKEYEEKRHELYVFYQTKNFCDLPSELRARALDDMNELQKINDESERQATAEKHPIFGLKPQQETTK